MSRKKPIFSAREVEANKLIATIMIDFKYESRNYIEDDDEIQCHTSRTVTDEEKPLESEALQSIASVTNKKLRVTAPVNKRKAKKKKNSKPKTKNEPSK